MSKRVQIAVIREATLNAKPTDTHYLAAGGLQISRKDAVALKGTTLYYKVMVDLGEVTGGDYIPGRDVPVYLTDSEPVLAFQPQLLHWVEPDIYASKGNHIDIDVSKGNPMPIKMWMAASGIDSNSLAETVAAQAAPEAPVKRRPGRPKKVVETAPVPVVLEEKAPEMDAGIQVEENDPVDVAAPAQDDESTFLIPPTGAPVRQDQPEFCFDVDEDEAPPPPPVSGAVVTDFVVEDEPNDNPATAEVENVPPPTPRNSDYPDADDDDYSNVDTGMFDE
jgi:hypothetical protein